MSKKNVEVEDVTSVEEVKETVEETKQEREPMEEPRTVNYEQMYAISDASRE